MKTAALLMSGLLIAFSAQAAEEAPAKALPDLAKGQATSAQVCGACHTADGSRGAPANPILQGQHAQYLVKQLIEFKEGKRSNPIMNGMAATLSPEDIKNVSAFYASKQAKPGFSKNKELIALGEKIYRGGIADRSIPACSGCHSPNGAGIPDQYPRLAGQHAEYIETQLLAMRAGTRTNSVPMTGVVAKMNDKEIKAVSDYIAGLR